MQRLDSSNDLGGPARQILATLARTGEATIVDLVEALGVTTTAVRQQVNRLAADDWIHCRKRRRGPGRPADVFSLTDKARQWFGQSAEHLCRLILQELSAELGPEQTRAVLRRVSARMAADLRAAVAGDGGRAADGGLAALARVLNESGTLAESAGTRLTVFTCPFPDLAPTHPEICEIEREAIGAALGVPVKLACCRDEGRVRCDFHVEQREPGATTARDTD